MGKNGVPQVCKNCGETFTHSAVMKDHWPACLAQAEARRGEPFYPTALSKKEGRKG